MRAFKPGQTHWDSSLPGFGARRQNSEAVVYVLFYRTREGRQRWLTIGRHGAPWTPDTAREEAKRLLGDVATSAILPPRNGKRAMLRRSPSCAIFTLPMPKQDGW